MNSTLVPEMAGFSDANPDNYFIQSFTIAGYNDANRHASAVIQGRHGMAVRLALRTPRINQMFLAFSSVSPLIPPASSIKPCALYDSLESDTGLLTITSI